jgi:hypothetical protein
MQESATGSFFKYLFGFLLFISVSFGVTFTVNTLGQAKDVTQAAAAARALMLEQIK